MKSRYSLFGFVVCFLLTIVSCKKEMFDNESYTRLLEESSPFSNIDLNHTWDLTNTYTVKVKTNLAEDIKVQKVCLLTHNPYNNYDAEIMAEAEMTLGAEKTFVFVAPSVKNELYAAILDTQGKYYLKSFTPGDSVVTFESGVEYPSSFLYTPIYQTFTYCFEDDYPKPSDDWDFNDLVLRICKQPSTASDELRLSVTITAAGTTKQMAAAIRLIGVNYSDIKKVTTVNGKTFDGEFSQQRVLIDKADLLLKGIHEEAVLNLFEDAHWALMPRLRDDGAGVVRLLYNTVSSPDGLTSAYVAPITITYIVKFNQSVDLSQFTLDCLDPFVVEDFNSGKWEIHTAEYKTAQVLRDYGENETAKANRVVWALKIPNNMFRYPKEKVNIGYYRDGKLAGAYQKDGHSFGQWVANQYDSKDWYNYPTNEEVY